LEIKQQEVSGKKYEVAKRPDIFICH